MESIWKQKRLPFWISLPDFVERCQSPSRREPRPAWLYDLRKPHVACLIVCNPRKNTLLKQGKQE
jgi:hypothetical protein